jgi:uncharacterized protein (DUF362 family)
MNGKSNRRDFLKLMGYFSAQAAFGSGLKAFSSTALNSYDERKAVTMAVAHGPSPKKTTIAAINALGGIKKFISKGDIVLVKPNISWDRRPEQAANTNPEVVATVVELCLDAGAKRVKVVDNSINDARRCYKRSGIADAASNAGATVEYPDERKFIDMNIKGEVLKSWPVYRDAVESDKVINVPIAKHHNLSRLTMGMKNWIGMVGGRRNRLHQQIHESITDLSFFFKPTLTILDASRILTENGPQGGSLSYVKKIDTIIAGTDQVAIDSFGATLFGLKGEDIGYIRLANKRGLGQMDLQKANILQLKA